MNNSGHFAAWVWRRQRVGGGEVIAQVGNIEAQFTVAETPIGCGQRGKNHND